MSQARPLAHSALTYSVPVLLTAALCVVGALLGWGCDPPDDLSGKEQRQSQTLVVGSASEVSEDARAQAPPPPNAAFAPELPEELRPLAPLSQEDLPPVTRAPPDPQHDKHELFPVFVRIGEVYLPSDGDPIIPKKHIIEPYLQEYLRRAGYRVVKSEAEAKYRVEGSFETEFESTMRVQGRVVAYKVRGECYFDVLDSSGGKVESHELPEVYEESVEGEESARVELGRRIASIEWGNLREGKVFGDAEITSILHALTVPAGEGGELRFVEDVVVRLANLGLRAVPFMLEAMIDRRAVELESRSMTPQSAGAAGRRVYHVADKVLEEIFQKVSRMRLDTPARLRFIIIRGWENEWRRFCEPYRASPNAAVRNRAGESSPSRRQ